MYFDIPGTQYRNFLYDIQHYLVHAMIITSEFEFQISTALKNRYPLQNRRCNMYLCTTATISEKFAGEQHAHIRAIKAFFFSRQQLIVDR